MRSVSVSSMSSRKVFGIIVAVLVHLALSMSWSAIYPVTDQPIYGLAAQILVSLAPILILFVAVATGAIIARGDFLVSAIAIWLVISLSGLWALAGSGFFEAWSFCEHALMLWPDLLGSLLATILGARLGAALHRRFSARPIMSK